MQFDSATFVAFFAAVLTVYALTPQWAARKNWLLIASWFFYASWNPWFLPLLIGSASLDWWMALRMDRAQGRARRAWLAAPIGINLLVLGYFKYIGFLADNLSALLASTGLRLATPEHSIILPIGISFYTFHSLSYCIDVYRRKFPPTRNWRDYALYVAFFPQLVAGPIVRWTFMRDQIQQARRTSVSMLGTGVALMLIGLFQKVVLADSLFAPVADQVFSAGQTLSATQAWIGTAAFSGQIFCDFAGYSTCAIGAARAFGFRLPLNFLNPYAALGLSDFWRRWHISLSTWLRDYLYIPLGGSRVGRARRNLNLMLTMGLGGFWHGAYRPSVVAAIGQVLEDHMRGIGYGSFSEPMGLAMPDNTTGLADPAQAVQSTFGMGASCPKCFSFNVKRDGGCETCLDCGHSKCG